MRLGVWEGAHTHTHTHTTTPTPLTPAPYPCVHVPAGLERLGVAWGAQARHQGQFWGAVAFGDLGGKTRGLRRRVGSWCWYPLWLGPGAQSRPLQPRG